MAFDTTLYNGIYDTIEAKAVETTNTFLDNYSITGEDKAQIIASVINTIIQESMIGMSKDKELQIQDEQLSQAKIGTAVATAIKPEKILSAKTDNLIKTHRLNVTIPKQDSKLDSDKSFIDEQKSQLSASVGYNNKIKALNSFSDLFGTLGAGGLVVPDSGWEFISAIGNDLTSQTLTSTGFADGVTKK